MKGPHHLGARGCRVRMIGSAVLLTALVPRAARAQGTPSDSQPQQPAPPALPVRVLDRPVTLPSGDRRFDAFALLTHAPGNPTTVTMVLAGAVGLGEHFEIGGQLVPFEVEPEMVFTNPSVYALYVFPIGKTVSLAPQIQLVYPLKSADPFIVDAGGFAYARLGNWGYFLFAPMFSLNTRGDESGSSLSFPISILRQASEQLAVRVTSGVGLSRFDPRFGVSRRSEALDFDELTVPLTAYVNYTVARGSPRRPLADLLLQFQWPQLYTNAPGMRGTHADDWAVQIKSFWFFLQ